MSKFDFNNVGLPQDKDVREAYEFYTSKFFGKRAGKNYDMEALGKYFDDRLDVCRTFAEVAMPRAVAAHLLELALSETVVLDKEYESARNAFRFRGEIEKLFSEEVISHLDNLMSAPARGVYDGLDEWKNVHPEAKMFALAFAVAQAPEQDKEDRGYYCDSWTNRFNHIVEMSAGLSPTLDARAAEIVNVGNEYRRERNAFNRKNGLI